MEHTIELFIELSEGRVVLKDVFQSAVKPTRVTCIEKQIGFQKFLEVYDSVADFARTYSVKFLEKLCNEYGTNYSFDTTSARLGLPTPHVLQPWPRYIVDKATRKETCTYPVAHVKCWEKHKYDPLKYRDDKGFMYPALFRALTKIYLIHRKYLEVPSRFWRDLLVMAKEEVDELMFGKENPDKKGLQRYTGVLRVATFSESTVLNSQGGSFIEGTGDEILEDYMEHERLFGKIENQHGPRTSHTEMRKNEDKFFGEVAEYVKKLQNEVGAIVVFADDKKFVQIDKFFSPVVFSHDFIMLGEFNIYRHGYEIRGIEGIWRDFKEVRIGRVINENGDCVDIEDEDIPNWRIYEARGVAVDYHAFRFDFHIRVLHDGKIYKTETYPNEITIAGEEHEVNRPKVLFNPEKNYLQITTKYGAAKTKRVIRHRYYALESKIEVAEDKLL
jgi:hypothetical protein